MITPPRSGRFYMIPVGRSEPFYRSLVAIRPPPLAGLPSALGWPPWWGAPPPARPGVARHCSVVAGRTLPFKTPTLHHQNDCYHTNDSPDLGIRPLKNHERALPGLPSPLLLDLSPLVRTQRESRTDTGTAHVARVRPRTHRLGSRAQHARSQVGTQVGVSE